MISNRSAIGTPVECKSRSTLLVHLPRLDGYGQQPQIKNGPALAGYGAQAMATALTKSMTCLPQQLRKTITWDRGKELSDHARFAVDTGTKVFFVGGTRVAGLTDAGCLRHPVWRGLGDDTDPGDVRV